MDRDGGPGPPAGIAAQLDHLEAVVGVLPISLRGWYEEVGTVNLVGDHPDWGFRYHDPLVVDAPVGYVLSEYEAWQDDRGTAWDQGAFEIPIAPDMLHKADVSGGPPYALEVPNPGADGLLRWERHQTTFVNYLRIAFRWGGCPGWDGGQRDEWAQPPAPVPGALREMAAELLPI